MARSVARETSRDESLPRAGNAADVEQVVREIRRRRSRSDAATFVVAIDGGGGAGKSTFADVLAPELDLAPVVRTDDFATWDNPLGWAPRFIELVLAPALRGDELHYQRSDWTKRALGSWIDVPSHRYLVVEGVGSTQLCFERFVSFAVWIETGRDERLRRGIERDGVDMASQWAQWMSEEDDYFARESPARRADVILRGDGDIG